MSRDHEQIEEVFREALKQELERRGHGAQAELSRKTGIKSAYLNHIVRGRKYGSEGTRRTIAQALGYRYEEFLDRGRMILGRKIERDEERILPFSDELQHIPPHSIERYKLIYWKISEEFGVPEILGFVRRGTVQLSEEFKSYEKGEIDDYDLFHQGKDRLARILEYIIKEFGGG